MPTYYTAIIQDMDNMDEYPEYKTVSTFPNKVDAIEYIVKYLKDEDYILDADGDSVFDALDTDGYWYDEFSELMCSIPESNLYIND